MAIILGEQTKRFLTARTVTTCSPSRCPELKSDVASIEIESFGEKAKHDIFSRCKSHLDDADIVIALLDGSLVDDGTAWETGYFYARKSPEQKIIGIRTDFRRAGESQGAVVNAMIECSCDRIVRSREELMGTVSKVF